MAWDENPPAKTRPVGLRVVPCFAWLPRRLDGRWRWLVPHYALQAAFLDEDGHLASWWFTMRRSMRPDCRRPD